MNQFTTLLLILAFQCQSLDANNSSENVLDEIAVQKICNSFNEAKCPYDDYCFNMFRLDLDGEYVDGEQRACLYCPSGGKEDDCDYYKRYRHYTKCPTSHKYYNKYGFVCTWRNNCPLESKINNNTITTRFDEQCTDQNCEEKTFYDRPVKCANDSKCVYDESECNICTSTNGGNESLCTEQYCESLKLTYWNRIEFGEDHKYIKCPKSGKCIILIVG